MLLPPAPLIPQAWDGIPHGEENSDDHIKTALLHFADGAFENGKLFWTMAGNFLCEFDGGRKEL